LASGAGNRGGSMKRISVSGILAFVFVLLPSLVSMAQGTTTFVSNLGDTTSGTMTVGSDSWLAADFVTGTNVGGYTLSSIQLAMADATGNPNDFSVILYTAVNDVGTFPGTSLGTLSGSANPATSGTYTYTAPSDLSLTASTAYFIVLTAGTSVANGAYAWSVTSTSSPGYNGYHWGGEIFFYESGNGINWNSTSSAYGQFSLDATPVPEPEVIGLFAMGGLLVGFLRWKARSV
jgi:hypothetical protein